MTPREFDWFEQLKIAAMVGIHPAEYYDLTPAEFFVFTSGYIKAKDQEAETTNRNLYNLAVLVRAAVGAKNMPKYESIFKSKQKQMSDNDMFAFVESLNKSLGGKE